MEPFFIICDMCNELVAIRIGLVLSEQYCFPQISTNIRITHHPYLICHAFYNIPIFLILKFVHLLCSYTKHYTYMLDDVGICELLQPSIIPQCLNHLLPLLPEQTVSTLIRLANLFDPSHSTIQPLLIKAHCSRKR